MKKLTLIVLVALSLAGCSCQQYASCNGVDGGLASRCGGKR